ncbi:DUF1642 domain-containing protein [Lactococcus lactis]|uniref:DUF1642 domain-containing protein n=1 Tax=Lactococcus lactis TaxID=1358 RepID=UPI0022B8F342|nr:DUF1642 domain-containing protein [Lactococcus lactis]MCZ8492170.1 DUF1642 domain-containing protein [Lactococcus lactis]
MTKTFEEELFNKVPCKFELTTEATYKKTTLINHFKNWHSDEEFQELLDKYSHLNDNYEKEVIRSSNLETSNLKLFAEGNGLLSDNVTLTKKVEDLKSQLQQQALPVVPELTQKQADILNDYKNGSGSLASYLSTEIKKGDYDYFARAWLDGYTVEKPQLFKLIFPNSTAVLQKDGELNSFADTVYKRYLMENAMTEQEIKSIDERYWQFAVPVEDNK